MEIQPTPSIMVAFEMTFGLMEGKYYPPTTTFIIRAYE
jgi:hypothetical protein